MSAADSLLALAELCNKGAHEVLEQLLALGPRPAAPPPAVLLWDQTYTRLSGQMSSLTTMAGKMAAGSVLAALETVDVDLSRLTAITATAKQRIKRIQEVSELLTTLGRVLDVGLAVLALATTPSAATATALAKSIQELAKDVGTDAAEGN